MSLPDLDTVLGWRGRMVRAADGEKLGKLGELYLDEDTGLPGYAGVRTGLLGRREAIVPLGGITDHDGDLLVPWDAETVRAAPSLDPDAALSDAEERALAQHFGVAADPSEPEVIRSEEEVEVGVAPMRARERVRLRKVLVTEDVPVVEERRREVVRLETEPPPAGRVESVEDV